MSVVAFRISLPLLQFSVLREESSSAADPISRDVGQV